MGRFVAFMSAFVFSPRAAAMEVIEKNKPELKENFTKNCGFGMENCQTVCSSQTQLCAGLGTGISFRDSGYILNSKNPKVFRAGMVGPRVIRTRFGGVMETESLA